MLVMDWKKVKGTQSEKPKALDTTSSPSTVYLRKNVQRITISDNNGNDIEMWEYEECSIDRKDYEKEPYAINEMIQNIEILQSQAEINNKLNIILSSLT